MTLTKRELELQALHDKVARTKEQAKALLAHVEKQAEPQSVTFNFTSKEISQVEADRLRRQVGGDLEYYLKDKVARGERFTIIQRTNWEKVLGKEKVARILKSGSAAPVMKARADQDTEIVYKSKEQPMTTVNKQYSVQEISLKEQLKHLMANYGGNMVKQMFLVALDEFAVNKSLDSAAPTHDPMFPGLKVPLTASQRAEYVAVQKAKANSEHDPFFGNLQVPKKRR